MNLFKIQNSGKTKLNKTKQKKKIREREREKDLPGLTRAAHQNRPSRPSPPPLLPPLSSSSCQWEQLRARTRAAEEATSSLPGCLLLPWSLPRRHAAPTPSHFSLALWTSLPLAPLFPLPRPNGAAATDESHRGYRPPHGSPTPQEAPPVLPLPPQRATRPRTCHNTALDAFFNLGTAGHLRQIRRLQTVPDLAERPLVIAVSH